MRWYIHTVKPGLHVRCKHKHKHKQKHKKPTRKPVRRKHKRLVLASVLMVASSRFTRTTQRHKHKHKHKRMERFPFSCACAFACACVVASFRRKPGRYKHRHKHKERKLKNSDNLSAYILVRHVGIKSRAKRQSSLAILLHFYASALAYVTLCLRSSHV